MEQNISIVNRQVILNYNKAYPKNRQALLKSRTFRKFISFYIRTLEQSNRKLYDYMTVDGQYTPDEGAEMFTRLLRLLSVFEYEEIDEDIPYLNSRALLGETINDLYGKWRSMLRFAFMNSTDTPDFGINMLVARDSDVNDLILRTYRLFDEKISGRPNLVYRQVQAGTNACFAVHPAIKHGWSERYKVLKDIPIIDHVMLRTPMILHPRANKRTGTFTRTDTNPFDEVTLNPNEWFCLPIKVGKLLCFVYFNTDYIAMALSMVNLFEMATIEEANEAPDLMILFGTDDGKNPDGSIVEKTDYYHDKEKNVWIGRVSNSINRMDYFGYLKKMTLTLHNLAMMDKGWLPIHGAMVNVTLKDGTTKGIMLMGDSGAGKSESIEALKAAGKDQIKEVSVVFDDMGTIHLENGIPYGQGTETGAFIRLDDLDPGTPYKDMDRSIFFGPEHPNARMVVPASSYAYITQNHPIDLFCYANNYEDVMGMKQLPADHVKATCKSGTRWALGTTQEEGMSHTYFANPFGPMQEQELCDPLIDEVFEALEKNGVFLGEVYTHLGFDKLNRTGLDIAAQQLLDFVMGKDDAASDEAAKEGE